MKLTKNVKTTPGKVSLGTYLSTNSFTGEKAPAAAAKRPRRGVLAHLGKTVRLRDKEHRKFVLRQPCLVCGRVPADQKDRQGHCSHNRG
jgi:hypothetical protein